MNLVTVMDAIADELTDHVIKRVYAWPTDSVTVPCMIVAYPETIVFANTMGNGPDEAMFPIWYVAGNVADRNTRDELALILDGVRSVEDALTGTLNDTVNVSTVEDAEIQTINIGGIEYAAVKFSVQIIN